MKLGGFDLVCISWYWVGKSGCPVRPCWTIIWLALSLPDLLKSAGILVSRKSRFDSPWKTIKIWQWLLYKWWQYPGQKRPPITSGWRIKRTTWLWAFVCWLNRKWMLVCVCVCVGRCIYICIHRKASSLWRPPAKFSSNQLRRNLSNPFKLQLVKENAHFHTPNVLTGCCIMVGHLKCNKRKRKRTQQISRCSFDS